MKILLVVLSVAGMFVATSSIAGEGYFGASTGIMNFEDDSAGTGFSDTPISLKVFGGYEFNENIALDVAYFSTVQDAGDESRRSSTEAGRGRCTPVCRSAQAKESRAFRFQRDPGRRESAGGDESFEASRLCLQISWQQTMNDFQHTTETNARGSLTIAQTACLNAADEFKHPTAQAQFEKAARRFAPIRFWIYRVRRRIIRAQRWILERQL